MQERMSFAWGATNLVVTDLRHSGARSDESGYEGGQPWARTVSKHTTSVTSLAADCHKTHRRIEPLAEWVRFHPLRCRCLLTSDSLKTCACGASCPLSRTGSAAGNAPCWCAPLSASGASSSTERVECGQAQGGESPSRAPPNLVSGVGLGECFCELAPETRTT